MKEQASRPTKDPTRLALQGQELTVDLSCQSRRRLSRKPERNKDHTTLGRTGSMPYNQPRLIADDWNRYLGTSETTPTRRPR